MTKLLIRRSLLLTPLLLVLVAGFGCASNDTRLVAQKLDPLIGKADKDYFIEKFGEPVERTRVDSHTDVWEWSVADRPLNERTNVGKSSISTRLRATFKDGILASWQAFNTVR